MTLTEKKKKKKKEREGKNTWKKANNKTNKQFADKELKTLVIS